MSRAKLTIGQLAKRTETSIVTIRYYERRGLISRSTRSEGGFRLYSEDIIPCFYFIKNAKAVGFSLDEIQELLQLQGGKNVSSQAIKNLTLSKIESIKSKVNTLKKMQKALETWEAACDGKVPIEKCPILEQLYQPPKKSQG